ncbi:MAG TPA: hypothetical protein VK892_11640, partial [Pyrinomonadaceae bacterium]|nr:hypothetical protein [Pyrinomonadaceae bacterium]
VQDKTISIKIDGNQNTRREFIAIIRSKFDEIHGSFDGLSVKEMLGHPKYPEILRDYYRLRSMEDDRIENEYVEELRIFLSVKDWLNGFDSVEERRKRDREREGNNIFIYGDNNKVFQGLKDTQINIQENIVDEVSSKMDETQRQIMEGLSDEILARIEEAFSALGKENSELKEVKKGKWETKLKFSLPFIPLEISRTITPDEFISKVRKWAYGDDLQLNILQAEAETKELLGQ